MYSQALVEEYADTVTWWAFAIPIMDVQDRRAGPNGVDTRFQPFLRINSTDAG
jgi:hypothetical protein